MTNPIKHIDLSKINLNQYPHHYVGCVVLTHDNKILLQQRGNDWDHFPGYLCEFGGHIEINETPMQALIRELNEEIGGIINASDVISFGAITESESNHTELIYVYFWQDKNATITGCYEGEAKLFNTVNEVLVKQNITNGLRWLLNECKKKKLLY